MKPKLTYAEFVAAQAQRNEGTVAWILNRYADEMDGTHTGRPIKALGPSQRYTYGTLSRSPHIGPIPWRELTKKHVIAHVQMRREQPTKRGTNVSAPTVKQDLTYLSVALKYAGSAWDDCEGCSAAAVQAATPFLSKHDLIGKSVPRERRPSPEEIDRLIEFFSKPAKRGFKRRINMVRMTYWQLRSSRRIGESCALLWEDWDREEHTIFVRKMKKQKNGKLVALPAKAQVMLEELWEMRDSNEPRIFPFNAKSVGAAYTEAKKVLGIKDLRLHDSRRDAGTRLVEDDGFSPSEAICFTGHETVQVFERTYLKMDPKKVKAGPLLKRRELAAA